jgi:hypothetical protein
MKIFIYEYVGEYCHGGYVCIAKNEGRARQLLIDTADYEEDKQDLREDFTNDEIGKLELKHTLPIDIKIEMILLDSYDCC